MSMSRPLEQLRCWMGGRLSSRAQCRWHKWNPVGPVRLADGSFSVPGRGQVWRRQVGDGFEYCQDDGFDEAADHDIAKIDWD